MRDAYGSNELLHPKRVKGWGWLKFHNWDFTIGVPHKNGSTTIKQFIWMNELEDEVTQLKNHQVNGNVYFVVRHPFDRFYSLWKHKCQGEYTLHRNPEIDGMAPEQLMTHIERGVKNVHWTPQSLLLGNLDPELIPLEELSNWWSSNGYGELGQFNKTEKLDVIDDKLKERLQNYYADDIVLYERAVQQWTN